MTTTHKYGEPVQRESTNLIEDQLARLREIFPEAFTEGKVDWDRLRATLGEAVDDGPERYTFTWAGKRDAIRLLQTPTRATLVPCREESVNFDHTGHIFIEGDNLEVLKLLYKPYFGRVKMIYIDPPYNTGNDFIYPDNYADPLATYLQLTGQVDAEGNLLTSNPETSGRYHSAWLSMMYPRLFLARQLLREDGVIFVSIDDHEVHNLRLLMNEVFGGEQFVADIAVVNNLKGRSDRKHVATAHEHLLMYVKEGFSSYGLRLTPEKLARFGEIDEEGRRFQWRDLRKRGGADTREERPNLFFPLYLNQEADTLSLEPSSNSDIPIHPTKSDGTEGCWRWGRERVAPELHTLKASRTKSSNRWNVYYRIYLEVDGEQRTSKPKSVWIGSQYATDLGQRAFKKLLPNVDPPSPPKAVGFLKEVLEQATSQDDICLDFFAGSCTMAQALLELNREDAGNRRFIMVQLPEPLPEARTLPNGTTLRTIADIGKERIRRVIAEMRKEQEGQLPLETREAPENLGFKVFKLTPSNYRPWSGVEERAPGAYAQQMELFSDPLVDGWTAENIICEVALKEGYGLNCRVETLEEVSDNTVYRVTDPDKGQAFLICLDNTFHPQTARALELDKDDLFICRDVALEDETTANLALQCRLKTI
jgi:adenine-specific DNA-methyltransferase